MSYLKYLLEIIPLVSKVIGGAEAIVGAIKKWYRNRRKEKIHEGQDGSDFQELL